MGLTKNNEKANTIKKSFKNKSILLNNYFLLILNIIINKY